jgi:hypothetical protein
VTCTVNVLVKVSVYAEPSVFEAAVVGVPEIVSPASVSPAGSVPLDTLHV